VNTRNLHWAIAYILHAIVASYGVTLCVFAMGVLLPNHSVLDPFRSPYFWGPIALGIVGGIVLGRKERLSILLLLWAVPFLIMCVELFTWWKYRLQGENFHQQIYDNFLGRDCGASECLEELIITSPLISAICYGVSALIAKSLNTKNRTDLSINQNVA
jgi:hypothetical protein